MRYSASGGTLNDHLSGPRPLVGIVLPNWNGLRDTIECLRSLAAIDYPRLEILVIDNGSVDGSADTLARKDGGFFFIASPENIGFAKANNLGIDFFLDRGADYVLLLNNDTVVDPDFLDRLLVVAESRPNGGVFGPKILSYADRRRRAR